MADLSVDAELAAYDEEEIEVRGGLTFRAPVEALPQTKRTEERQKAKIEMLRKRKEDAEAQRRAKEQEEAQRRLKEQEAKKLKQQQEQKKKEEERRRREEEEQRKKMEGGLDQILGALQRNASPQHITVCGIELGSVRLRLLAQALEANTSCRSMDLSRKGLTDDDGVSIASMLKKNVHLQKLELEGNNLGTKTGRALAEALLQNEILRAINLESNNLTASGNDQTGVIAIAAALQKNRSLRVLTLSKNHITQQGGEQFVRSMTQNECLTLLDLSGNELGIEQLRRVENVIRKNREGLSVLRRMERRERFALYNEEFQCRQYDMQVEAMRLELEAMSERRLNRMKARFEEWRNLAEKEARAEAEEMENLMSEYEDRKEARSKKKKGKKK